MLHLAPPPLPGSPRLHQRDCDARRRRRRRALQQSRPPLRAARRCRPRAVLAAGLRAAARRRRSARDAPGRRAPVLGRARRMRRSRLGAPAARAAAWSPVAHANTCTVQAVLYKATCRTIPVPATTGRRRSSLVGESSRPCTGRVLQKFVSILMTPEVLNEPASEFYRT